MPKGQLPSLWIPDMKLYNSALRLSYDPDATTHSFDLELPASNVLGPNKLYSTCTLHVRGSMTTHGACSKGLIVRTHFKLLHRYESYKGNGWDGATPRLLTCLGVHKSKVCKRYEAVRWAQQREACCRPLAACSFSMPLIVTAVPPRKISFRLLRSCKASAPASLTCLHLLRSRYASSGIPASAFTAASLMLPQPRRFNLHAS